MALRIGVAAALALFTAACSGETSSTGGQDGRVATSDGASSGGSGSSSGGGSSSSGGSSSGGGGAQDGSTAGPVDGGPDFSANTLADVQVPDAFPATCSLADFSLVPDAGPGYCAFTPADVACNANTDCGWYEAVGCGCVQRIFGVNKNSTARCIPPPCAPPLGGSVCDASGLYTQDCQVVSDTNNVFAACVNHQCRTFSTATSP
jgi:hypothetical protein